MRAIVILFLFVNFVVYAQTKSEKLYSKAILFEKEREIEQAILQYKKTIKLDSAFFKAYTALIRNYDLLGDIKSKVGICKELVRQPTSERYHFYYLQLVDYHYLQGDYGESKKYIKKALPLFSENSKEYLYLLKRQESVDFSIQSRENKLGSLLTPVFPNLPFTSYPLAINDSLLYINVRTLLAKYKKSAISVAIKMNGEWKHPVALEVNINTVIDQGKCTFSSKGDTIIFTSCNRKGTRGGCDLYFSTIKDGQWTKPENLGDSINSIAWDSEPSLSADGNTLFFSSRREGGYGKEDIWYSTKKNGVWGKAQHLDKSVNSPEREVTPFIHSNGQLFFSSTEGISMGGFDVYSSTRIGDKWSAKENVGAPINSEKDESGFMIVPNLKTAYFSRYLPSQKVMGQPESKTYSYELQDELLLESVEQKLTFSGVLFETDSYAVDTVFQKELAQLVIALQRNKEVSIEVVGHTDNVGSSNDNVILSKKRADSVAKLLTEKGIDVTRIHVKGLGDIQPIASNQTDEGKQKNRRIEILFHVF
ncbi:MAG: OmpA family protein [Cyclobacteriaceae bacterium]